MSDAPARPSSLWIETTPQTDYPLLAPGVEVDVAVAGGGIAGITTAYLLKRAGRSVALLESKRILHGATGYTTAKVTAGHGLTYARLERRLGGEAARLYAAAQTRGLELVRQVVADEGIDCELEERVNYVYADTAEEVGRVREEAAAAQRAGLPASFVHELELPYAVAGAARLEGQAQFHPRKYLLALAARIDGDGSHVFEQTRLLDVDAGRPLRVKTDRGELRAGHLVVATHLPVLDRGLFFAKAHPSRSYAVAARVPPDRLPLLMAINVGTPTRSLRTARDDRGPLLILGGEGHRPGAEEDTGRRFEALELFGRRWFGAEDFPYRWATQDYSPVDGVPYVGRLGMGERHVWVATGFRKWGMTNGTVAAELLVDGILARANRFSPLFDAQRLNARASLPGLVRENLEVARRFVFDRLRRGGPAELEELAPGDGRIARMRGRATAVYRDETGFVHALSPVCTHLGCHVAWNRAERTWDCPCHGSRFSGEGHVIQGPAVRDLEPRNAPR
jgi:glycine/D-amino acid oxidase-like deaminating enzyme/nitrite reductase/ring-hydroxylating ferredoxin subunit